MQRVRDEQADDGALADWFEEVSGAEWTWYVKYLSANDTYAKPNVHQGGPYVAKDVLKLVFPQLTERASRARNPDLQLPVSVGAGADETQLELRLVWYNSKRLGQSNGRDEARLTKWGGAEAPVVNANSTGALVVFAYHQPTKKADADSIKVWVARDEDEQERILDKTGPVDPGDGIVVTPTGLVLAKPAVAIDRSCSFTDATLPKSWRRVFPTGEALIEAVVERLPSAKKHGPDRRLIQRRDCEYRMFRSVEQYHVLPRLEERFASVDHFIHFAHSVTNRRKSRSGRSLELQLKAIFREEGLSFASGKHTEGSRKPDFIFPSMERYWDAKWPDDRLRMLGAKTTVKDRWRQILNEARRVQQKHLITLQEGVSGEQFREMEEEGVVLVVPESLHSTYPDSVRPKLLTLRQFIAGTKQVCG